MKQKLGPSACPCGGVIKGAAYAICCQPYIEGREQAPTAEHLMRSRYTAYALGISNYVLDTWHSSTRPASLALDPPGTPNATRWLELTVHRHTPLTNTEAQVLFTARYREGGRAHRLQEHSRFVREDGRWFYVAGDVDFDAPPR